MSVGGDRIEVYPLEFVARVLILKKSVVGA